MYTGFKLTLILHVHIRFFFVCNLHKFHYTYTLKYKKENLFDFDLPLVRIKYDEPAIYSIILYGFADVVVLSVIVYD